METDGDPAPDEGNSKKHRQRKKHLYKSILSQMEFYFSDSNLAKERFLTELMKKSEYVDLSVFLKFNKIRKLTTTIEDIVKSLKNSDFLELSEDCTCVKRKTPVQIKENVEDCTIYVENIQSDTSHDWLKNVFSEFGNVLYVSIPKYRHNKLNKGFAFIEFETEDEAKQTIEYFESINSKINSQMAPEELCSIKTFIEEEKIKEDQNLCNTDKNGEDNDLINDTIKNNANKRKLDAAEAEENTQIKKTKPNDDETPNIKEDDDRRKIQNIKEGDKNTNLKHNIKESESSGEEDEKIKKIKLDEKGQNIEDEGKNNISKENSSEESKRKKKKSKKKTLIKEMGLHVLPKIEWKKMRNRYLDMQKNKMKQLKQHLNRRRFNNRFEDKTSCETIEKVESEGENKKSKLEFTPGVIVKLTLPEICTDLKKTKNEIKTMSANIEYVDIPPTINNDEVFIRFSSNDSAKDFCATSAGGEGVLLEGDEEVAYWEKIKSSRDIKFKREIKKQRGRDKLLKKAERELGKHIIFDNDE